MRDELMKIVGRMDAFVATRDKHEPIQQYMYWNGRHHERKENADIVAAFAAELRALADRSGGVADGLADIGELICTQDNRITSHPIFVVEQKREYVAHPDYDHDHIVWVNDDHQEADQAEAARLEAEFAETYQEPEGWRRLAVGHTWEFVTACFTEQGCKDYLAANGHNLKEPRIYVHSGWRNREWQRLRAALTAAPSPDAQHCAQGVEL